MNMLYSKYMIRKRRCFKRHVFAVDVCQPKKIKTEHTTKNLQNFKRLFKCQATSKRFISYFEKMRYESLATHVHKPKWRKEDARRFSPHYPLTIGGRHSVVILVCLTQVRHCCYCCYSSPAVWENTRTQNGRDIPVERYASHIGVCGGDVW